MDIRWTCVQIVEVGNVECHSFRGPTPSTAMELLQAAGGDDSIAVAHQRYSWHNTHTIKHMHTIVVLCYLVMCCDVWYGGEDRGGRSVQ